MSSAGEISEYDELTFVQKEIIHQLLAEHNEGSTQTRSAAATDSVKDITPLAAPHNVSPTPALPFRLDYRNYVNQS
jgi:hypothetical protein